MAAKLEGGDLVAGPLKKELYLFCGFPKEQTGNACLQTRILGISDLGLNPDPTPRMLRIRILLPAANTPSHHGRMGCKSDSSAAISEPQPHVYQSGAEPCPFYKP